MIYLISVQPNLYYTESTIHGIITTMNGVTDWWYYTGVYLIESDRTPLQITTEIRKYFPNLQHFITKVDLSLSAGILPKEAWDWINKKYPSLANLLKIKPTAKPPITLPPIQPLQPDALRRALDELLKNKK